MIKRIKNRSEKVYELHFTKSQSIFKEQKKLAAPSESSRFNRSSNDLLFKNFKTSLFVNKKETFGKVFLIKDTLKTYDWKLEKETKMIGNYLCLKATTEKDIKNRISRFRRFSKKDTKNKVTKKTKIIAWYTPEIPVSNGPKDFQGLPGLILQIDAGNTQYLCTKIVLNPKEKIEIIPPNKGKVITQKKYDNVVVEKSKEMRERYKNKRKKRSNNSRKHRSF